MTVHGEDGLDEISIAGPTRVVEVDETGARRDYVLTPEEFGISRRPVEQLRGGTAAENAATAMSLLGREGVLLNAGASLYICGVARNIGEGYLLAREALATGRVAAKLEQIRGLGTPRHSGGGGKAPARAA